jgi:uncharacterized ion transporter superfamily protein YfcC
MNIFSHYIKYLKDNPHHYWFKRKVYGWGWTPARWQGWLVLLIAIAFIVWSVLGISSGDGLVDPIWYFMKIALAVIILIFICYKTGEKPRWQWGIPKEEEGHLNGLN